MGGALRWQRTLVAAGWPLALHFAISDAVWSDAFVYWRSGGVLAVSLVGIALVLAIATRRDERAARAAWLTALALAPLVYLYSRLPFDQTVCPAPEFLTRGATRALRWSPGALIDPFIIGALAVALASFAWPRLSDRTWWRLALAALASLVLALALAGLRLLAWPEPRDYVASLPVVAELHAGGEVSWLGPSVEDPQSPWVPADPPVGASQEPEELGPALEPSYTEDLVATGPLPVHLWQVCHRRVEALIPRRGCVLKWAWPLTGITGSPVGGGFAPEPPFVVRADSRAAIWYVSGAHEPDLVFASFRAEPDPWLVGGSRWDDPSQQEHRELAFVPFRRIAASLGPPRAFLAAAAVGLVLAAGLLARRDPVGVLTVSVVTAAPLVAWVTLFVA